MFPRSPPSPNPFTPCVPQAGEHLPERAAAAVLTLALDPALGGAFPGVQEAAVAYLEQVDPDGRALQRRVARAALWMESTCGFLKESQAQVTPRCAPEPTGTPEVDAVPGL